MLNGVVNECQGIRVILYFPYFKGEWSSLLDWRDETSQAEKGGLSRDKVENFSCMSFELTEILSCLAWFKETKH